MSDDQVQKETETPLEILFQRAREVELGGEKITFHKVEFRHVKPVITMMRTLVNELEFKDGAPTVDIKDPVWILEFIERHVEDVASLLTMMTSATREQIDRLPIDDVLAISVMAVMVNRAFFYERVLPLFRKRGSNSGSGSQQS